MSASMKMKMRRRSTSAKLGGGLQQQSTTVDPLECPACKKRVTIGVQCSGCAQWWHNTAPCSDPSQSSANFMPYLCETCFQYAHQVKKTRSSEFPTVASAQKWSSVPVGSTLTGRGGLEGGDEHADFFQGDGDEGDDPEDDPAAFSLLVNSTLHAVRNIVKQSNRVQSSSAFSSTAARDIPKELIVSALTRVYSYGKDAHGDSSPEDDADDTDDYSSSDVDSESSSPTASEDGAPGRKGKSGLGVASTRRRFAPCTAKISAAHRRLGANISQRLSSMLREPLHEEFKDDLQIDIRPEDLLRLEGGGKAHGGGTPSVGPSRSTSNSNLAILRRKNAAADSSTQRSSTSGGSGGAGGCGGGSGAPREHARQRSFHYLHRGGDEETLREHFQSASLAADSESARRVQQERKLAAAKKLIDQHKKVLRQRYEASQQRRAGGGGGGGGGSVQPGTQHSKDAPADPLMEDPFLQTAPLAPHSRRVFDAHKRMYFADVPPPAVAYHSGNGTSAATAFQAQLHRGPGSSRRDLASMNVRLSALEEVHEDGVSENSIMILRGSTEGSGGTADGEFFDDDVLEKQFYSSQRHPNDDDDDVGGETNPFGVASTTVRPPTAWKVPF